MTRTRKWTVGTALLVLVLLLAGWFLVVSPKRSEAAELTAQTAAQEITNTALRGKIEVLREQAKELPAQQAKLAEIRQKLPANPALPGLIRSLSSIAAKSGVTLVSIEPQTPEEVTLPETESEGPTPATTTESTDATAEDTATAEEEQGTGLQVIAVAITVRGGYFDVEQFFNKAEDLTRSLRVTGFVMAPEDSDNASSDLSAVINAQVYYAPVQPAATTTTTSSAK